MTAGVARAASVSGRVLRLALAPASLPGRLLFGPVFDKEVRVAGRKRITYIGRSLYVLLLLSITLIAYAGSVDLSGLASTPAARIQSLQDLAPVLAQTVLWTQFVVVLLVAPTATSSGISEERRRQTLSALLTTPITAGQIVFGKLSAAMSQITIILVLGVPFLLAARVFGGLPVLQIIAGGVLTASVALLGLAVGLWASTRVAQAARSAMLSMLVYVLVLFGPVLLLGMVHFWLVEAYSHATFREVAGWGPEVRLGVPEILLAGSCPLLAMVAVMTGEFGFGGWELNGLWLGSAAWTGLLALAFAWLAVRGVRRAMTLDLPEKTKRRRRRAGRGASEPDGDPGATRRREPRIRSNPVLWRELRQALFPKKRFLAVTMLGLMFVMGLLYWNLGIGDEVTHFSVFLVGICVYLLQATMLSTSGVTGERETRTWDVLLTTRVPPASLLAGKLLGTLRRQWPVPVLLGIHVAVSMAADSMTWHIIPVLALVLTGPAVMLCGMGLLASLVFRKTVTATAANLGAALVLWLGSMISLALLQEIFDLWGNELFERILTGAIFFNPVAMTGVSVDALAFPARMDHGEFDMPAGSLGYGTALFGLGVATLVQAGIGLVALAFARAGYDWFAPRSS